MELIDGKTVIDQELIERRLLHWDKPTESCAVRHLHTGASCPNAETAPAWMQEEEEALIRLEQDVDSLLDSHRAHCPECQPLVQNSPYEHAARWDGPRTCRLAMQLKLAGARSAAARILNQQRQDDATPLPEFSPVKA